EPGSVVEKGSVLYCIEDSKYHNDVTQAQAHLTNARATYDYSSRQYQAMKKALESDAVSQMDVVQAKSAMEEAQAAIRNAEAALHSAQLNLGYCTVTAPFTGRVSKCAFSVGAYVGGAGSPVVLGTIYDDAVLNAYFAIEDAQYLKMLNAEINKENIDYNAIPLTFTQPMSHKYTGQLDYLAPSIDPSTGTMSIRAKVKNPYGELRSGQYVKIMLPYASDPNAILINDASISTDQKGKYVYVVNDDNKVVYTPIEVGELVNDTMRIVTSGLTPQSRYVTKALLKVRDGMVVKPIETR
ncbi:MAG: efflux RND transporter periplasmic adaptor subunit, partial [Muribaculaceae bacterium]|nr:efflux RND transporter periplasmic adaptor subunit [Muribaculaceae bacterium]